MGNQPSLSASTTPTQTIYILKLEEGKYYIGKTNSLADRYAQHCEGIGSKWTTKYKPICILDTHPGDGYDEDMYTKRFMGLYGIENVRGGSYCMVELDKSIIYHLEREIRSAEDKCLSCGSDGHMAKECQTKEKGKENILTNYCDRCDRSGHNKDKCFAKTKLDGTILPNNNICYNCKEVGHYASQCLKK